MKRRIEGEKECWGEVAMETINFFYPGRASSSGGLFSSDETRENKDQGEHGNREPVQGMGKEKK